MFNWVGNMILEKSEISSYVNSFLKGSFLNSGGIGITQHHTNEHFNNKGIHYNHSDNKSNYKFKLNNEKVDRHFNELGTLKLKKWSTKK